MNTKERSKQRRRFADSLRKASLRRSQIKDGLWNNVWNDVKNIGRSIKKFSYSNTDDALSQIMSYADSHPKARFNVRGQVQLGNTTKLATLAVDKGKFLLISNDDRKKLSGGKIDDLYLALEQFGFSGVKKGSKSSASEKTKEAKTSEETKTKEGGESEKKKTEKKSYKADPSKVENLSKEGKETAKNLKKTAESLGKDEQKTYYCNSYLSSSMYLVLSKRFYLLFETEAKKEGGISKTHAKQLAGGNNENLAAALGQFYVDSVKEIKMPKLDSYDWAIG